MRGLIYQLASVQTRILTTAQAHWNNTITLEKRHLLTRLKMPLRPLIPFSGCGNLVCVGVCVGVAWRASFQYPPMYSWRRKWRSPGRNTCGTRKMMSDACMYKL